MQVSTHEASDKPLRRTRLAEASRFFIVIGLAAAFALGIVASAVAPVASMRVPIGYAAYASTPDSFCAGTASDCH